MKDIKREQAQMALRIMAGKAREAHEGWVRELEACRDKGLSATPALTERHAHWVMARLMLHIAVTELLFSGRNTARVDRYVRDLIAGERWPAEDG